MKAIILAAGQGTRLRPYTDDRPKCLVPYRGKPILEHTLDVLRKARIDDITIVTGYRGEMLDGFGARTVLNPDFAHTNMLHSLFCAEGDLARGAIVVYGDIVFTDYVLKILLSAPADAGIAVTVDRAWRALWERRMADPLSDAETLKVRDEKIVELGKKPSSYDEIEGQYIGLFRISAEAAPRVREFYHRLDRQKLYDGRPFDQMYMTTFLQQIADGLMPLTPAWIEGGWIEIDTPSDLELPLER